VFASVLRPALITAAAVVSLAAAPHEAVALDRTVFREAVAAAERGDVAGATARMQRLDDPAARDLVEYFLLRSGAAGIGSQRIARFLTTNAHWPGDAMLRIRAEQALLNERRPASEVIAFFGNATPRSAHGRVALAIALRERGQADRAAQLVRDAWRTLEVPQSLEALVAERLPGVLTRADEVARMHRVFYKERASDGLRLAQRLGGNDLVIARAWSAVVNGAGNAGALLDAVPAGARADAGYQFARIRWLRRQERFRDAAQMLLAAPQDRRVIVDGDEWWTERRLVARKILEEGDARTAYRIVAGHAAARDVERMDAEFHAGWIALRFLNDPASADRHFARLAADAARPISVARGAYWRGRAAEAAGNPMAANQHYETAARHRTTFYGQVAMARLGRNQLQIAAPISPSAEARQRFAQRSAIRAIRLLHSAGMIDKARPFFRDMADELRDVNEVALLAQLGAELGQVRFQLLVGKQALQRGMPLDHHAYPMNGVPNVASAGPAVERAVVLGLSRQESTFDPVIRSSAGAVGLMQLLPTTARETARRYNVTWTPGRITDPSYNTQLGSAYLGEAIERYDGSYILAFAAYNAGRGRVSEWLQRFGDPRDPRVDPIDWIERIPFSETRNYVMRVMENVQVYRARLGSPQLRIAEDLRRRRGGGTTTVARD
jgi:soluble lytic murein transglycosylase